MAKYNKTNKTTEELVSSLKEKGLIISNNAKAINYIRNIGYFRLKAYFYPLYKEPKHKHLFKQEASFDKLMNMYRFDRKLRLLLFNEIEKIEVSFRSTLANMVAEETGNIFWITDSSIFANSNKYNKTIELIDKELKGSKEDFILHFKNKYSNPYPPAWMLVEILPLGIVTRIFENIKSNSLKKKIAARYELPAPVLTSWLTVITLTRNSCCHHSRVWNRIYAVTPMIAKKLSRPWINNCISPLKTFYDICIIKWFIDILSPNNDMKEHLLSLIRAYPNVDVKAMGFPDQWEEEPLWSK